MKRIILITLIAGLAFFNIESILSFCGFYVAKADGKMYNSASKVVLVRSEDKNVISMMNDYKGELKDFAMVIPVPVILKREQINVGKSEDIDHIDAFSAPRLVEYFDEDPCNIRVDYDEEYKKVESVPTSEVSKGGRVKQDLGVKVEASYTVGEYDIVILSAKYSDGLETWLTQNGYKIPKGAKDALQPYIKQKLKFFVAKVNLKEQKAAGLTYLRPLQFAYQSEKFMLPIRLGMINANGPQELLIYVLTKNGRVETTNYRTIFLPTDTEIPEFVKNDFKSFYLAMFDKLVKSENYRTVITEHFWDMNWCDPCAAEPLQPDELKRLGVFWQDGNNPYGSAPVKVTRLHLRYTSDTFPEDLVFQETADTANFQGRYVMRHAWNGSPNSCSEAKEYFKNLKVRQKQEIKNLSKLTGWSEKDIKTKMNFQDTLEENSKDTEWYKKIWK